MGRPIKEGLDYFPLDVSFDDNMDLLELECGLEGFAILMKLWQKIYSENYFIKWEAKNEKLFAHKNNMDIKKLKTVITQCFELDILDKKLFEDYKILTSKGIQKRYFKVCSEAKRTSVNIIQDFILISSEFIPEKFGVNSGLSAQRKGKESKVKESKGEKSTNSTLPSVFDIENFGKRQGYKIDGQKVLDTYLKNGQLKDTKGNVFTDWQDKVKRLWCTDDKKLPAEADLSHLEGYLNLKQLVIDGKMELELANDYKRDLVRKGHKRTTT